MIILGLVCATLAVLCIVLERAYQRVPARELKRLARSGDSIAELLYKPAAYGASLRVLLGGLAVLFGMIGLALAVQALGSWFGIIVVLVWLAAGAFIAVPSGELTRSSLWLAQKTAPLLNWLLERLQSSIDAVVRFVRRHKPVTIHTGLYEKADLIALLERQKGQADSRISTSEIALLQHSLSFGDKLVADTLVPKRVVTMVSAHEHIGPVLMDELTKSGHSRFPVYETKRDNIVGVLYLRDLVGIKQSGTVAAVMSHKLTYVHEDFTLYQALQAFLKTKQHIFLVVNNFEELVGIVTIEDVLEQMIGKPIVDEFDHYDDLRAVAAAAAKKDHRTHTEPKVEPTPTTEAPEVVK